MGTDRDEVLIRVRNLKKHFAIKRGFLQTLFTSEAPGVRAVDDIDFEIHRGEILGLVGESGSGKTTTGRLLIRLIELTDGHMLFRYYPDEMPPEFNEFVPSKAIVEEPDGTFVNISALPDEALRFLRRKMQIVFQDPYDSLSPKFTIFQTVAEALRIQKISRDEDEIVAKVRQALEDVELTPPEDYFNRYPHELSGGQRQRIAMARTLVLEPELIVADEPVSMLDVSIRGEILNMMFDLAEKRNVAILYITHDLALSRHTCDRVGVMYLGKLVEVADVDRLVKNPQHPYTKALIESAANIDPQRELRDTLLTGEIPSPIDPPTGCRLHPRCPLAEMPTCRDNEPPMEEKEPGHRAACFFSDQIPRLDEEEFDKVHHEEEV